jgi:esterase/lipase superfamily enzyme
MKLSKMGCSCIKYATDNENFHYARKHFESILDVLTKAKD